MTDAYKKESRLLSATSSVSGAASILGSWQICHSICLGLIAVLSIAGITLTGMPLAFFTKIAVPMWWIAVALLGVVVFMYWKKRCVSKNLLLINGGLITAGTPYLQSIRWGFWIVGGAGVLAGIIFFIRERLHKKPRCCHES